MNKGHHTSRGRELRRNRWIGVGIFLLLAIAGWGYYLYCMHSAIPVTGDRQAQTKSPAGKDIPLESAIPGKESSVKEGKGATAARSDCPTAGTDVPAQDASHTYPDCRLCLEGLGLPFFEDEDFVIRNESGRYTLLYDTLYRQAAWVAYIVSRTDVGHGGAKRRDRFAADPEVIFRNWPAALPSHYRGTGYDRGHLCPSADRMASQEGNDCTFYMSNIAPQTAALNRGPWKQLEEQVREWAVRYDSLYVVTGGVLSDGLKTIAGGIGVPEYFYKAVLTRSEGEFRAIGFLLPNGKNFEGAYSDYAVSVDSLETVTSIDFFHTLPDDLELRVESACSKDFWFGRVP